MLLIRNLKFFLKNKIKIIFLPFTDRGKGHEPDFIFLTTVLILVVFGLIILTSASSVVAYQTFGDSYFFLKRQIVNGLLFGLVLFFIFLNIDYYKLRQYSFWLFAATVLFLFLVLIPGVGSSYGGSARWLEIFGFNFQPSELSKLTFAIYLASWLEKRGERGVRDFYHGLLPFVFITILMMVLVLLQPDLGTALIIGFIAVIIYIIAGASMKHIGIGMLLATVFLIFVIVLSSYRFDRLKAFFNPGADPLNIGYHTIQAKIAIGSGGILGLGLGHSRQKYNYLPEVYGDSIFAIIAEELGLIFALTVIALFLTILVRGLRIAKNSIDRLGQLLAIGIISWICCQAFLNISSMVALVPLTGVPLPFVSYGGTALATLLGACGLLLNISKFTKKTI